MGKKQSRTCRNGAQCQNKQCGFKHPDGHLSTQEAVSLLPLLDDQKQNDIEEAEFLSSMLHTVYINDMASAIAYTGWDEDKPYVIETFLELGMFSTWDDAYDALLNFVYKDDADNTSKDQDVSAI